MGKSFLVVTLTWFLLLVSMVVAGLDKACKKSPDPEFCRLLLQPSAAEFEGGDPKKMGSAAMKATLRKVMAARAYLMDTAVKKAKNKELKVAIMDCVDDFNHAAGTLNATVSVMDIIADSNSPRKLGKPIPTKMIDTAATDLTACRDALKKNEAAGLAAGGDNADVTRQALRSAEESVLACAVTKSIIGS